MTVQIRPLTLDDAPAVAELIRARDGTDFDQHDPDFTSAELREWWQARGLDGVGAWVAVDGRRVVGFAKLHVEGDVAELEDDSCVHPEWRGRGVGSLFVDRLEAWARERGLPRVRAGVVTEPGRSLLEERGYDLVRHFWRMEVRLDAEPQMADPPAGIALRMYRPGADDRVVHAALEEAFEDHWEFVPTPFDDWLRRHTTRADHDPELWTLAEEDGEVAGVILCYGARDFGWVLELAVRRRWRGRGLGLALLRKGLRECYVRGFTRVGLEVDAANPMGATRVYERAGMHVTRRYDWYELRL
jgi:mycothiol synthase